jgi:hypothetical protein
MRQKLVQVLEKNDDDEPMDAVVRRFWSRTPRLPGANASADAGRAATPGVGATLVDLAAWVQARGRGEPVQS